MTNIRPLAPRQIDKIEGRALETLATNPRDTDAADKLRLIATIRIVDDNGDLLAARDAASGHGAYLPSEMVDALLDGGNFIKVWRGHRGFTLTELAAKAGLGKSFLSQLENDKKKPSVKSLKALAKALDCDMDDLA